MPQFHNIWSSALYQGHFYLLLLTLTLLARLSIKRHFEKKYLQKQLETDLDRAPKVSEGHSYHVIVNSANECQNRGTPVTDFQVSSKSAPTQVLRTPASKTSVSTSQKKMVQFGFGWGPVHTCEPELGGHDPCPQKPEMLIFD